MEKCFYHFVKLIDNKKFASGKFVRGC